MSAHTDWQRATGPAHEDIWEHRVREVYVPCAWQYEETLLNECGKDGFHLVAVIETTYNRRYYLKRKAVA
jgi:hypothetical protein